jgi:hypothetical protein
MTLFYHVLMPRSILHEMHGLVERGEPAKRGEATGMLTRLRRQRMAPGGPPLEFCLNLRGQCKGNLHDTTRFGVDQAGATLIACCIV